MEHILDEAAAVVQCKECPWYRGCVTPMRFGPEDIRRQLQSALPPGLGFGGEEGLQGLLANLSAAAQSMLLESCPIFVQRLRSSPRLAERIKRLMQNWGAEEEPTR